MMILQRMYEHLKTAGMDARLATQHSGVCTESYCVVYEGETEHTKTMSIRHVLIDVIVPIGKVATLEGETARAAACASAAGYRVSVIGASIVLDDYRAVMRTLDVSALCARY